MVREGREAAVAAWCLLLTESVSAEGFGDKFISSTRVEQRSFVPGPRQFASQSTAALQFL
jgi:hypothetical protein